MHVILANPEPLFLMPDSLAARGTRLVHEIILPACRH
jgi:hypothetical protein